ncbi:MAG: flagellar protein FliS, partial [Anaerolineaceae bacterium]|nr:flagellar protein FliS [Anaerolineaceae bacterium]
MYPQAVYQTKEYRNQEVMGASPIRLVVMAYDLAIQACEQQDFARAAKAITALRNALDFDYPDVSVGLFRLYQYCLDCLRKGEYAAVQSTLGELRAAWSGAEKPEASGRSAQKALQEGRISA